MVSGQEHADQAQVVVQVAQVDDAAGDGLEARAAAEQPQQLAAAVTEQAGQRREPIR
jgi:hypothetical protein